MNAKDAAKYTLNLNMDMLKAFLSDLSDADILTRPVPGANHTAWQLGHLITSEPHLLAMIPGVTPTELPAGFAEKHSKETASSDSPAGFLKKVEYLEVFDKVRAGTLAYLDKLSDADMDKPTEGQMKEYAPKVGDVFLLIGNHTMMHAGQITVLRRKLGKPVLF